MQNFLYLEMCGIHSDLAGCSGALTLIEPSELRI